MANHTPGPWTYTYGATGDDEYMVMTADTTVVAHVWPDEERRVEGSIVEANARLIAAAPELLEALRLLLNLRSIYTIGAAHGFGSPGRSQS